MMWQILLPALPLLILIAPCIAWALWALNSTRGAYLPEPRRRASPVSSALVLYALRKKAGHNVP